MADRRFSCGRAVQQWTAATWSPDAIKYRRRRTMRARLGVAPKTSEWAVRRSSRSTFPSGRLWIVWCFVALFNQRLATCDEGKAMSGEKARPGLAGWYTGMAQIQMLGPRVKTVGASVLEWLSLGNDKKGAVQCALVLVLGARCWMVGRRRRQDPRPLDTVGTGYATGYKGRGKCAARPLSLLCWHSQLQPFQAVLVGVPGILLSRQRGVLKPPAQGS